MVFWDRIIDGWRLLEMGNGYFASWGMRGGDFIKTAFIRRCLDTVHGHESCDMQQICPLVQKKHVFFF